MENETHITRREALKKMGAVAVGAALSASGLSAAESLNVTEKRKMKVVAINGSARRDVPDGTPLGKWVARQRAVYQNPEKEHCRLTPQRIRLLEQIGMQWQRPGSWEHRYALAQEYLRQHGDLAIPAKYRAADGILLGSPTYSADVSATLKAVMERASVVCDNNRGMFRHKVCGAIAVARRAGAMNVLDTLNHFFLNKEAFLVGSTYWNVAYGRLPGEALHDEEGVETMKHLGQHMAWLLEKINEQ